MKKYIGIILLFLICNPANAAEITITSPHNGTIVSGKVAITVSLTNDVQLVRIYIDYSLVAIAPPPATYEWNTTVYSNGKHTILANAYSSSDGQLGSASINVSVANNSSTPTPTPKPTSTATPTPTPVAGCNAPGLAGNPLLSDADAASAVQMTPLSVVETSSTTGAVNAAANAYYYNNGSSSYYQNQLAGFRSYWPNDAQIARVDGACNLGPSPRTAEILQWAAYKWGFSPLVTYAEATNDGKWDMTSLGDSGCSVGIAQVAFCNNATHPNHVIPGLNTGQAGHLLPQENTCFNVDLYAAFLYKRYTGSGCAHDDLAIAIQDWGSGQVCSPQQFAQANCNSIATHDWNTRFFKGAQVPY